MRRLVKYGGLTLGAIVLAGLCGILALYLNAAEPRRSIAVRQAEVADPGHGAIPVSVFYPTTAQPGFMVLGTFPVRLAPGGPVDGRNLPIVIISHGNQGTAWSHIDTAIALAEEGYVVVAPQHPGDNLRDTSSVGSSTWFADRARHVSRAADFVTRQWDGRRSIDSRRIGIFGFSAGGTTALVSIGGSLDSDLLRARCRERQEFACSLIRPEALQAGFAGPRGSDPRIKAAVVVAPGFGFGFSPQSLARVRTPVQIWQGAADKNVPPTTNGRAVRAMLSSPSEYRLVPAATHFTFLAPCGPASIILPGELCADPSGLDRSIFHASFNSEVVRFFDRTLAANSQPGDD